MLKFLKWTLLVFVLTTVVSTFAAAALAVQDSTVTAPAPVPGDWVAIWLSITGFLTTALTQLLKGISAKFDGAPDWVKSVVALAIAFLSTRAADFFGAPIPPDLAGFAAVFVAWATGMGLHALAKWLKIVKPSPVPAPISSASRRSQPGAF